MKKTKQNGNEIKNTSAGHSSGRIGAVPNAAQESRLVAHRVASSRALTVVSMATGRGKKKEKKNGIPPKKKQNRNVTPKKEKK